MIEKKILSVILNNPELLKDFYKYNYEFQDKDCNYIYALIISLVKKNKKFNSQLILDYILEKKDFNVIAYNEILDIDFVKSNYKMYLTELLGLDLKRKINRYCMQLRENKYKNYIDIKYDIINLANEIKEIEEKEIENSKNICCNLLEDLKKDYTQKKIYSAIEYFEKFQGGYDLTDYIIIGAVESVGKTSFIIDRIVKQIKKDIKIAVFSCEMLRKKFYQLLACNIAGIDSNLVDKKQLNEIQKEKYIDALTRIYDKELYIDDSTRNWEEIKNKIKILKKEKNIDIVYIDYMQYLRVKDAKVAYDRLEIISSDTKELNKELKIPICHIVTLNREGKKAEEPQTYHIKGNGDIEYDADIIILMKAFKEEIEEDSNERVVEFFIKKNRNGKRGKFKMIFHTSVRRFFEEEKFFEVVRVK